MALVPTQTPDAEFLSHVDWEEDGPDIRTSFWYDGLYYQIEWTQTDDPDFATEWLGEYTDTDDQDLIGDRKNGVLYGAWVDHSRKFSDESEAEKFYEELREDDGVRKTDDEDIDEDDEDGWEVTWNERQILSEDGLSNYGGTRTFEFWKPAEDKIPKSGDVLTEEEIGWLVQYWRRMEGYGDAWISVQITAEVYKDPDFEDQVGAEAGFGTEREVSYGADDSYFNDSLAQAAHEAAYEALGTEVEWPEHLALVRYVLSWMSQYCTFVITPDPESFELTTLPIWQTDPSMGVYLGELRALTSEATL